MSEAREVLKYLRALEPHWQPLYEADLAAVHAALGPLLGNIATMHAVARWARICCAALRQPPCLLRFFLVLLEGLCDTVRRCPAGIGGGCALTMC